MMLQYVESADWENEGRYWHFINPTRAECQAFPI